MVTWKDPDEFRRELMCEPVLELKELHRHQFGQVEGAMDVGLKDATAVWFRRCTGPHGCGAILVVDDGIGGISEQGREALKSGKGELDETSSP